MKLTVCPFSVVVFIGTSMWYVQQLRKKRQQKNYDHVPNNIKQEVIFVLGGPGVGKGTQCQLVQQRLSSKNTMYIHLSAGDLLRAERSKPDSIVAKQINDCISSGQLVPSIITCQLIQNAMKESINNLHQTMQVTFLIDGFPRSADNAKVWNETPMGQMISIKCIWYFICPEEITIGRLIQRGQATGRSDDQNITTIRQRLQTFENETKPIIQFYQNETSIPVHTIPTDQPVDNVYQNVIQFILK